MNQDKVKRLEEIFRKNNNQGIAIAITGSWGVGKTFFWNKFLEARAKSEQDRKYLPLHIRQKYKNIFNKKYSYVSLFGIESLADLKVAISTNMSSNDFNDESSRNFEIPKFFKKSISAIRDVKISGSGKGIGINSSAKIFEALLYFQVKDAIICFDDFERMSNKLDIKDVMGLANQLKLERNCQVVLILDESKTDVKSQKKYAEYKEKLIDETIIINSVEPLIRENAKDIDKELIDLIVKFADALNIHNFRFFQKVIILYKSFRAELPEIVANSTKEIIMIRILQGYFISDFGEKFEFGWDDIKRVTEEKQKNWSNRKIKTYKAFDSFKNSFMKIDQWGLEFKNWFEQKNDFDSEQFLELVKSDLISEKNNDIKYEFWKLFNQIWNYQCDENFNKIFFDSSIKNVGLDSLGNLSFAITILEKFGALAESLELEEKVKDWIKIKLAENRKSFRGMNSFGHGEHIFNKFIEQYLEDNQTQGLPSLIDSIYSKLINQQYSNDHSNVLDQATKKDLKQFIEIDFFNDERFNYGTIASLVEKFPTNQKQMVIEILNERRKNSEFQEKYIDFIISKLDK